MEIDSKTVLKIARLSKIKLSKEEAEDIKGDLNKIVEFVKKLSEVDSINTEEFSFGKSFFSDLRRDIVNEKNVAEDILKNTSNKNQQFFTVPKIVE